MLLSLKSDEMSKTWKEASDCISLVLENAKIKLNLFFQPFAILEDNRFKTFFPGLKLHVFST